MTTCARTRPVDGQGRGFSGRPKRYINRARVRSSEHKVCTRRTRFTVHCRARHRRRHQPHTDRNSAASPEKEKPSAKTTKMIATAVVYCSVSVSHARGSLSGLSISDPERAVFKSLDRLPKLGID